MLWSKKLKVCSKLSELIFSPHKCLLPDVILNKSVNKLTWKKHFLRQKCLWTVWEMSVSREKVSITHRSSFFLLSFYGESLVISAFQAILHVCFMISSKSISASQNIKVFHFLSVRNFPNKFSSSSCGSSLGVEFHIFFFQI